MNGNARIKANVAARNIAQIGLARNEAHEYFLDGQGPIPSVTTILKIVDKSGPLIGWAKRITAERSSGPPRGRRKEMGNEVAATGPIRLTLPVGEAMYALDALSVASAKAWATVRLLTETQAPVDEREIAEMAALYLDRAHRRLDGALFPVCRYLQEDDCTWPVTAYDERGTPYCESHFARISRIREAYPR